MATHYFTGWTLDPKQREKLLREIPPAYPDIVAHHVTLSAHATPVTPRPSPVHAEIVGAVDDGNGVQALVVEINGTSRRPGGGTYHITWSLDKRRGRRAVESNDAIARYPSTDLPRRTVEVQPVKTPRH
jgi:hypothetical protein